MKKGIIFLTFVSAIVLGGCTTTSVVQKELAVDEGAIYSYEIEVAEGIKVDKNSLVSIKEALDAEMNSNGLINPDGTAERRMEIVINFFNMRSGTARFMGGILAGTDKLDTDVKIYNVADNSLIGQFNVVSKNNTGWGTTGGFYEKHARNIVAKLTRLKG